jgi:uncharacterized protein YndB with AHSA1/START domain
VKQYTETVHVDLPPKKVFAIVVDPENQAGRFMKVETVEETPDGVGTTLRYYYRLLGMDLPGGTYTYSEYVPGKRFTWEFSGGPERFLAGGPVKSTLTFEAADGGTDMTITTEFATKIPVLNPLVRGIMLWSWRNRDLPKWKALIEEKAKVPAKA